ncbi:hypothetical protein RJT34_29990 [Clitoria ternatea]|uniref:RING-type E3 ubiquitin transferase n=1 Tax=Clitoria ternatea TaxID=43366 RepID=A0AAN9I1L3_CLITE
MSSDSSDSHDLSGWKTEEVFSIILVCVIFFTLSGCHIILKHLLCALCGAFTPRSQVQRRLLDVSIPGDASLQLQSRGLEFSVVKSLPMSQFKKNEGDVEHKTMNIDCAICLGEYEEGEWLKLLPNCSHRFHIRCIDTWFESHSNCPLCRTVVLHLLPANNNQESFVSSGTLLETLRREEFFQERVHHFQSFHSENLTIRQQPSG